LVIESSLKVVAVSLSSCLAGSLLHGGGRTFALSEVPVLSIGFTLMHLR